MSNSLQPHELQHARLPCPSLSPGVVLDSCPLSQGCYITIREGCAYLPCNFQNQNPNSKEHYNSLICFIAMWMLLFCNNLLTKFPLWALAAPILAFGPRSYYLCRSCRDGFWGQSGKLTSLQWSCCCCSCRSPFPQGLAARATAAASAAAGTVIATSLGPAPAPANRCPLPTAHCGSRDHSSPASL